MTLWQRLFGRRQLDRELEVELRDHLERQVADYMREGSSEAEARRRAAANFGGIQQVKEYLPRRPGDAVAGRSRHRRALRPSHAGSQPHLHARRRAVARAGHRRQHRHLHARQQPAAADAAGARPRAAGADWRRQLDEPDLGRDQEPPASAVRRRRRLVATAVRPVARRTAAAGRRALGQWRVLRRLWCPGDSRSYLHDGERPPRRRRRRDGGRHQLRVLAAAVRRGRRCHRPHADPQPNRLHRHRRHAAGVSRAGHRPQLRRRRAAADGGDPRSRRRPAPDRPIVLVARHHRAPEGRPVDRSGHGRAAGRAAGDP